MSSAGLFKEQEKFVKRQAEASAFLASNEKRQKIEKPSSQKTNRPKSAISRSKTLSGLNYYSMYAYRYLRIYFLDITSDSHSSSSNSKPRNLKLTNIVEKLQVNKKEMII